jgi:hypothetical protein
MTGKTVLSFQEWEAQSGMADAQEVNPMGMEMPAAYPGEEMPSHEPVQPGLEVMPVEEPGDLSKMDEPEEPGKEDQDENSPMMM